jgi:hypothetical protein
MMMRISLIATTLCSGLAFVAFGQESKKEDAKVVHSKISEGTKSCGAACRVNFTKELGLPLEYLSSIGHRISVAQKTPDPVDLALASKALAVAEKVSGKLASITAAQIEKEALELTKMRCWGNW